VGGVGEEEEKGEGAAERRLDEEPEIWAKDEQNEISVKATSSIAQHF
jgi:hypothetical protein